MDNLSGQMVKGYELSERIGTGGFGAVYRAHQSTVGREVAMKIILPGFANHPDFIRSFETEAQVIARLEHLHIVPLYDYWREPDGAYLVMRWLKGGSLRDALERNGSYDLESAALLLDQIASALAVAHRQNVIHRDLKPGNILLDEDANAYLADFGIAKDLTKLSDSTTQADDIVGSPDYLAPEQARSEMVTPQTDIYSLGVVLYEILTGLHPFPNLSAVERLYKHLYDPLPSIDNLQPDTRDRVNAVIQKATAKNPAHRYADAPAMALAFREAIALYTKEATGNLVEVLTAREQEILRYMVEGRANKQIAEQLFVTVATVKWYITQIYRKLGVRSRVQAMVRARELNLLATSFTSDGAVSPSGAMVIPTDQFQPENPYKGLHPFQTADHRDFFGREKLTERLIKRIAETGEMSRFLAIIGPSGSGKSSLVKAGLIPALWRGDLPGSARWFVVEMLPGTRPLDELEVALTRVATISAANVHEHLKRDQYGLLRAASLILPNDGSELVLVIDQFEELFTLVEEADRAYFLGLLHAAVTAPHSRIRVVMTLRADFYDRPLQYPDFGELVRNRMETILPLGAKGIERAIVGPAERVGVTFEDGLVAQIVEEMHYQTGALPLLQYALTELFERRQGKLLTKTAYQEIGGAVGALAKRAEDLFREFTPDSQEAIRQMFLRLVTLSEGADTTRRRVHRAELLAIAAEPELMDEVIDTFATYRLLSLDNDPITRSPTVEVAHEAILREWERLRMWLDENQSEIRLQRQLAHAAHEWSDSALDPSFLMRGTRLEQFEHWASSTQLALTQQERGFLQSSIDYRAREQASEQERQAREVRLERRSRTFLRGLVVVLLLATIGAFALTTIALNQSHIANRNAELSQSLALASAAQSALIEDHTDQALVLAVAANQIDAPPAFSQRLLYDSAFAPGTIRRMPCTGQWCFAMDVSPDERTVLTDDGLGGVVLSDIATGQPIHTFAGHSEPVGWGIAFMPDGQRFISAGFDDQMLLWDIDSGEIIRQYASPYHDFNQIDISPDGRLVAAATQDGVAMIWDIETGEIIHELFGHDTRAQIVAVAFSPDGRTLLSGSEDTTMILWDVETGELLHRFEGHTNAVISVHFSPDSRSALSTSFDNLMILWDVTTGQEIRRFSGHTNWVFNARFTPDGQHILSASRDQTLILWDVATGNPLHTYTGETGMALNVKLLANGTQAISSHNTGYLRHWQLNAQNIISQFGEQAPSADHDIIDDTLLGDGDLLALSADGTSAAAPGAGVDADEILLWNVETGELTRRFAGHEGNIASLAFSPDQHHLISGGWDNALILWDTETGDPIRRFTGHSGAVFDVAFSPDGRQALSVSEDQTVILWDVETGKLMRRFEDFTDSVNTVAFSPDGQTWLVGFGTIRAVAEGENYGMRLYDTATGQVIHHLEGHTAPITTAIFSPDGKTILSGSTDATVRLWDVATGDEFRRFTGHATTVWSVSYSPDGHYAASGSQDTTVMVWDLLTGEQIRILEGHEALVQGVAFLPDDGKLLSASADGVLHTWNLALDLSSLLSWTSSHRYVRELSCSERELFRLSPLCNELGVS